MKLPSVFFTPRKSKTKRIKVTDVRTGERKSIRVLKTKHKKTSMPRRICLVCRAVSIHKLSRYYDSKVCKSCHTGPLPTSMPKIPRIISIQGNTGEVTQ